MNETKIVHLDFRFTYDFVLYGSLLVLLYLLSIHVDNVVRSSIE